MNNLLHSLPLFIPPLFSLFSTMSDDDVSHMGCICPTPCADPTLTINNLRLVMASVKNWYGLGRYTGGLDVPHAVCNEIMASTAYQTEEEKKEALLLYYLRTMPMASWQNVAGALHWRKEVTALRAVKALLKYTPAGQLILQGTYISMLLHVCP